MRTSFQVFKWTFLIIFSLLWFAKATTDASVRSELTEYGSSGFSTQTNPWIFLSPKPFKNSQVLKLKSNKSYQEIWGFGASITESCLVNLNKLVPDARHKLMQSLFQKQRGAGFNYIRVPLGANDFSIGDYTLNDTVNNTSDPELKKFNSTKLQPFINFVKEAQQYNPDIKVMLSPWTPPAWMKDSQNLRGGQIKRKYYSSFAKYLSKSVKVFEEQGLKATHISLLNEPLIGDAKVSWYFPQAYMSPEDQHYFISNYLVAEMNKNANFPKLLLHDHNWDNSLAIKPIAEDVKLRPYVAGMAYHCYGGDFNTQSQVLKEDFAYLPGFNTECSSTHSQNNGIESFQWWLKNQSLDSLRMGSSGALGWNFCLNEEGGPRNDGCKDCRGLVTIDTKQNNSIKYNAEYYALSVASRYLEAGARRIDITNDTHGTDKVSYVAFINPNGQYVILLRNESQAEQIVSIFSPKQNKYIVTKVPVGAAINILD